jgi:hypothetical protein
MRRLSGHTGGVRAVTYAPDGRLVSAGEDRTVRVWGPTTGEPVLTLRASNTLYAVAISPDGRTLAYAGRYPRPADLGTPIHLWDLAAGRAAGEYRLPPFSSPRSIWSLSFSADGSVLAAVGRRQGGGNYTNGAGGHWWGPRRDGPLADDAAFALAFARDRPVLAVTGDGQVGFYLGPEAASAEVSYRLPISRPEAVAFLPGTADAVVAAGSYLYVVNAARAGRRRRIKTGFRVLTSVAAFPDGRAVVAGGKPGAVEVFDPIGGVRRAEYDFGLGGVYGVAVAPDGLTFAVAGEKGLVVCDADAW